MKEQNVRTEDNYTLLLGGKATFVKRRSTYRAKKGKKVLLKESIAYRLLVPPSRRVVGVKRKDGVICGSFPLYLAPPLPPPYCNFLPIHLAPSPTPSVTFISAVASPHPHVLPAVTSSSTTSPSSPLRKQAPALHPPNAICLHYISLHPQLLHPTPRPL